MQQVCIDNNSTTGQTRIERLKLVERLNTD